MYIGRMFRPPSEARSVIIQVTVGCAHNACKFCSMYKDKDFSVRPIEEIEAQIRYFSAIEPSAKRVFLADGDALVLPTKTLLKITEMIKEAFPEIQRISSYATPRDLLQKGPDELKSIREAGIGMLYLGLESGSEEVLDLMSKGVSPKEMIEAAQKAKTAGFELSVTLISGLGGIELTQTHAEESAKVLNQMQPNFLGLLTLLLDEETPINDWIQKGQFELLTPLQVIQETYQLMGLLELNDCMFRSNHASNYLALAGKLPQDQVALLRELELILESPEQLDGNYCRRL